MSVSLLKDFVLLWIQQVKDILWKCVLYLKQIRVRHSNISLLEALLKIFVSLNFVNFQ